ncbi:MAG: Pyrimidine-specific ribonucleoside hydrolase RihA [Anaerolineales bacterium]|nr:Pyrimidine-specific ribonucleoside hydrolase RihA [Anaerolineales bacterium]
MKKVIIDCDPGHDDALAILLAAKHLDVLGITTVAGNQTLDKVTDNALKVVEFAGLTHIPVAKGMGHPLIRPPRHVPEVHGETGLDGPDLPAPTTPLDPRHAVDFIIETVMSTEDVILVPIGPLTNIATALRREPRIAGRIQEISLMGGSLTYGNSTPAAEFNIYVDPEAAHIVFTSGVPIRMCGLNVTRQVPATEVEIERIRGLGTRTSAIVAESLDFYRDTLKRVFGLRGGSLHDPCAVAALIDLSAVPAQAGPTLIEFEPMHVAVELKGEHTYGMTVCDCRHLRGRGQVSTSDGGVWRGEPPNAEVAVDIDKDRLIDLLIDTLAKYP